MNLQTTCAKFSCRNNSFTKKKIKDCTLQILFCNQTIQLEITSRNRSISDDNSDESSYKLKEGKSRSDLNAEFAHFLPFGQSVFVPVDERSSSNALDEKAMKTVQREDNFNQRTFFHVDDP